MKLHANAKLGPKGRLVMCRRIVDKGWSLTDAADAAGVSIRTCSKWLSRYRSDGEAGLADRSSVPHTVPHRTSVERIQAITALRTLRMSSTEIALCLGMALSTVSAVLTRIGLGRLSRLEPVEPPNRYARRRPGELIHIDVKQLGRIGRVGHRIHQDRRTRVRGIGWEYVHVCIDDATRLAYVEVRDDEKATSAVAFLRHAIAFYAAHGIDVERVMTDG
jgi:leucine-zipper of insertion element IS481/Integrase core domain